MNAQRSIRRTELPQGMASMASADKVSPARSVGFRPIRSALHPPKKVAVNPPIPQQETAKTATFPENPLLARKNERNGKAIAPMRFTRIPDQRIQKSDGSPPTASCQIKESFFRIGFFTESVHGSQGRGGIQKLESKMRKRGNSHAVRQRLRRRRAGLTA